MVQPFKTIRSSNRQGDIYQWQLIFLRAIFSKYFPAKTPHSKHRICPRTACFILPTLHHQFTCNIFLTFPLDNQFNAMEALLSLLDTGVGSFVRTEPPNQQFRVSGPKRFRVSGPKQIVRIQAPNQKFWVSGCFLSLIKNNKKIL